MHPVYTRLRQCRQELLHWLVELGMTPASRGRVRPVAASASEFDEFEEWEGVLP